MEDSTMMIVTNSYLLLFQRGVFLLCLCSFILHQHDIIINMAILFQIAYYVYFVPQILSISSVM